MWRLPGERVRLDLDGPSVEVEPIYSWMIQAECLVLAQRLKEADEGPAEYVALGNLFEVFVREAMPQWDIADHLGPIPATVAGMRRLPLTLQSSILDQWIQSLEEEEEAERPELPGLTLVESPAPSAVDAVVPPGPLNREIKKRLRRAKAA